MAIVLVLVAFALRAALDPILGQRSPFLLFTVSIVIAAGRYGTAAGALSFVLSMIAGTALFMARGFPPQLSADEWGSLGIFVATSAAMLSFSRHLANARKREKELEIALHQQRTNVAIDSMAATLAHELNQPLAAASNYVGASKRLATALEGEVKPKIMVGLGEAETQIKRAGDIIRHARELVSNDSAVREQASLEAIVANAMNLLRASGVCDAATVHVAVDREADEVTVNSIQIEQVVLNLLRNACQAANGGDTLDISVLGTVMKDFALVEIRDLGPGIPADRLETLFVPRSKPSDRGLGLGLPISRTIIEAHRGRIWAQNNAAGGASFFFTVPRELRPS